MTITDLVFGAAMTLTLSPLSAPFTRAGEHPQQPSDSLKPFVLPAVRMDGDTVGSLILGQTTLKDALRMLPPYGGHGPSKKPDLSESSDPPNVLDVLKRVKQAYNPAFTLLILHFDQRDKLIIVHSTDDSYLSTIGEIRSRYPQLHEVSRDARKIRLQAQVHPCVMLEVFHAPEAQARDTVRSVGYLFTCDT